MPKPEPKAPPGVDPSRFKVLKLEGVQIRALIGKGGETVQDIRHRSGAEVKIDHLPTEVWGSVTIVGDVEKTEQMVKEALAAKGCPLGAPRPQPGMSNPALPGALPMLPGVVQGALPLPGTMPGMPGMPASLPALPAGTPALASIPGVVPLQPGALQGMASGASRAPAPVAPGPPREVQVPAELVGGLIGPGGSTINELRQKAGGQVHISVLPASTPGGPQIARISGPEQLLSQAETLVKTKLDELKQARQPKQLPPPPMPRTPANLGNAGVRPGLMNTPQQGTMPTSSLGVPQQGTMPGGIRPGLVGAPLPGTMPGTQMLQRGPVMGAGARPSVPTPPRPRPVGAPSGIVGNMPPGPPGMNQVGNQHLSPALQLQSLLRAPPSNFSGNSPNNLHGGPAGGLPSSLPSRPATPPGVVPKGGYTLTPAGASAKCGMPPRPPPPPSHMTNTNVAAQGGGNDWGGKGGGDTWGNKGASDWNGKGGNSDWGGQEHWYQTGPERYPPTSGTVWEDAPSTSWNASMNRIGNAGDGKIWNEPWERWDGGSAAHNQWGGAPATGCDPGMQAAMPGPPQIVE